MVIIKFLQFLGGPSFICEYDIFTTINLGILGLSAIVFGFYSIRKDIEEEFNDKFEGTFDRKTQDVLKTVLNRKIKSFRKKLKRIGDFLLGIIYMNIFSLFMTIMCQFSGYVLLDLMIIASTIVSTVFLLINLSRFNKLSNIDVEESIKEISEGYNLYKGISKTKDFEKFYELIYKKD
jgi:hypothetical protein